MTPLLATRLCSLTRLCSHSVTFKAVGLRSYDQIRLAGHAKLQNIKGTNKEKSEGKPEDPFERLKARRVDTEDIYGQLGEEISGKKLDKQMIIVKLNDFYQLQSVRDLAKSHYISEKLFAKAFISFRRYCQKSESLPPELYAKLCDIIDGHGHVSDLFPYFLTHARDCLPHLKCHEELCKISDLRLPHGWYPEARAKVRKIIFHAGPTNSGKTYHAMERFLKSGSGIYCGPLKMLAGEIYHKANEHNTPCDLVTGEERRFADPDGHTKSEHVSCTVEMAQLDQPIDVAVIDEIQMIRDPSRGWAWTRALLGMPANEVHLCGEDAALDLVKKILEPTGDILEVIHYKRLTPLIIEDKPLMSLKNIRSGDCIVCFNKDSLYQISMELENLGHKVAVVYSTLPPGAKLAQCKKFNALDEVKVMVATDAIGMGLNLSIGRIIFYSLIKSHEYLSTSQCLQIAGRAGRYRTAHETGYVTTYRAEDLKTLKTIMSHPVSSIERAGLHPTVDDIETFAYHLPQLDFVQLVDLYMELCTCDSSAYFISDMKSFKILAEAIKHINLSLRSKYTFCCAPIDVRSSFSIAMFTKFVRQFSANQPVSAQFVTRSINWPIKDPKKLKDLHHLETIYDIFELYLWLSYRFPDVFPEPDQIRALQIELDYTISNGVAHIVQLASQERS